MTAAAALATLQKLANPRFREEMGPRYGIVTDKAWGVPMAGMLRIAKAAGRSHALALELWASGWYEARTLAALVDEIDQVTPAQMDAWCRDFDNWAICDSVCFKLFDQSPHAPKKVAAWVKKRGEYQKRAGFALLASMALHGRGDEAFLLNGMGLIEQAAGDERNFVKKAVNWALRAIGQRNSRLHVAAMKLSRKLAASDSASARWIGKDAARELQKPAVLKRLAQRQEKS